LTSEQLAQFDPAQVETLAVYRKLTEASRALAEFKGVVATIPNERILLTALAMQEAKDSSAIENIVTSHDELFRSAADGDSGVGGAAKEVLRYRQALSVGFDLVRQHGLITNNHIQRIQAELEPRKPGFRKVPGTTLRDQARRLIYTPPQNPLRIVALMHQLEQELNAPPNDGMDPLVRMAVLHHRFESIHPFSDGNGRTGRILNVLFLLKEGLLELPVLYMSRYIVRTKTWVLYMLTAVAESAHDGLGTVNAIRRALQETKSELRAFPFYSQDLLNNLFAHPYTKIQFVVDELGVSRITATKYLDAITAAGIVRKIKAGRSNYYVNVRLFEILARNG
jgi:Fic family protein